MPSLRDIHRALEELDPDKYLGQLSYNLTYNDGLGLSSASDFHVGIPYNPWMPLGADRPEHFESTLAICLKDVLRKGLESLEDSIGVFIDIAQLWTGEWSGFFNSTDQAGHNLASSLGNLIASIPSDTTPIIRILLGLNNVTTAQERWEEDLRPEFENVFWPDGKCVFAHPNAQIHVGFFSPSFNAARDPHATLTSIDGIYAFAEIIRDMANNIRSSLHTFLPQSLKTLIEDTLSQFTKDQVLKFLSQTFLPSISWNHAKILAVNGQTLMTGGAIYYPYYGDNQAWISDLQAKLKGDAANSAHAYCNYIWRYLNRDHPTDEHSFRYHATSRDSCVSMWSADVETPLFIAKPRCKSGKPVLTVNKIGHWRSVNGGIEYPVQILDATRDIILNILWHLLRQHASGVIWIFEAMIMSAVTDERLLPNFKRAGVAATAWASRIARCKAIKDATRSVYIDTDTIACCLQKDSEPWIQLLESMNGPLRMAGLSAWDGILWPYDIIAAIASFMRSLPDRGSEGVFILLTTPLLDGREYTGWEDPIAANEFKQRIRSFARRPMGETDESFTQWFDARCHVKRLSNDASWSNHCKVVCVDQEVLYVGSDNIYPNYNTEHGIWIEDKDAIQSWYESYWNPRWDVSPVADMVPVVGSA